MDVRVPVLRGPLRGCWWIPGSGGKVLRFFLGSYEPEQVRRFRERVSPGCVVWDVGAHVGYYTLLASRLAGPAGAVVAFEPSPTNLRYLRAHVRINRCENVDVVAMAVSERAGYAMFERGGGTGRGRLAAGGGIAVRTTTLDRAARDRTAGPDVLKMDVEGEEPRALAGGRGVLGRDRPVIFLSTHGRRQLDGCRELLRSFDYRLSAIGPEDPGGSMELLCVPA